MKNILFLNTKKLGGAQSGGAYSGGANGMIFL
jgi:hypothetical protein